MTQQRLKERILKLIETRGRIKKSEIAKAIQGSTEAREDALRSLMTENLIHSMYGDSTGGRTAIWYSLKATAETVQKDLEEDQQQRAAWRHEEKWKGNKQKLLTYIKDFGPISMSQLHQKYPTLGEKSAMLIELQKENLIWMAQQKNGTRGIPANMYGWHEHEKPPEIKLSTNGGWIAQRLWYWIRMPGTASLEMWNLLDQFGFNHVIKMTWEDGAGKYTMDEITKRAIEIANSSEYFEEYTYWEANHCTEKSQAMQDHGLKMGFIEAQPVT